MRGKDIDDLARKPATDRQGNVVPADWLADREFLRMLVAQLVQNPNIDKTLAKRFAAALARYLADAYPKESHRPSTRDADYWIAADYRIRVAHRGEKADAAALEISQRLKEVGRVVTPGRVKTIGSDIGDAAVKQAEHTVGMYPGYRDQLERAQQDAELGWKRAVERQVSRLAKPKARVRKGR